MRIAELVREGKLDMISDLRDESDQRGMSIVIELKRNAQPKKVLNQLYKYTALQSTFGVQLLALVTDENGRSEPRTLFFSSRRRHTRYWRDWSSDVCSSDLCRVRRRSSPARCRRAGNR